MPAVVFGIIACLRAGGGPRRWGVIVLLLTAASLVTTTLFYGYVRLGLLLTPFWLACAAYGVVKLAGSLRRERSGRRREAAAGVGAPSQSFLVALGAVALLLLVAEIYTV